MELWSYGVMELWRLLLHTGSSFFIWSGALDSSGLLLLYPLMLLA